MKIVFLNTWDGRMRENLHAFLLEQIKDTDVLCLQEVHTSALAVFEDLLKNYTRTAAEKIINSQNLFGNSTYTSADTRVISSEILYPTESEIGLALYTEIEYRSKTYHLVNIHGWARPGTKLDTPERIRFSTEILRFMGTKTGPKIIGGDLNLFPETQSVQMFEAHGYQNLIKDYNITNTRNRFSWDLFPDLPQQHFADFVFVSADVVVTDFQVIDNEASDHLPMILEIEG